MLILGQWKPFRYRDVFGGVIHVTQPCFIDIENLGHGSLYFILKV